MLLLKIKQLVEYHNVACEFFTQPPHLRLRASWNLFRITPLPSFQSTSLLLSRQLISDCHKLSCGFPEIDKQQAKLTA